MEGIMRKQPHSVVELTKGINVSLTPLLLADQESPNLQNVRFDKGILKKELGSRPFGKGVLDGYVMHIDSFPMRSGSVHDLFVTPTTVYHLQSNGSFLSKVTTSLTGTEDDNFSSATGLDASGNDIFILTNGVDDIQKWDGGAGDFTDLGGLTTILAKFVIFYQNRLILGWTTESGTKCPTRCRWSVLGDPEDFSGAGSGFVELIDTTDWVTGFCYFKNRLFVIKERSIWELIYVGGTTVFSPYRVVDGVGSYIEVIGLGDVLVIYGTDSVYLYDGYSLTPISDQIYPLLYETDSKIVNFDKISRARAAYIEELEEYWLSVPTQGSVPDTIFKYNFGTQSWMVTKREVTAFGYYSVTSTELWSEQTANWNTKEGFWMVDKATSGAPTTLFGDSNGCIVEDDRTTKKLEKWVFPPAHDANYVASYNDQGANYRPWLATDPSKSLVGAAAGNCWLSQVGYYGNERFHVDLGSAKKVTRIYYENFHDAGANTNRGVKAFTFWGSNDANAFADLVYANNANWTQLPTTASSLDPSSTAGMLSRHANSNIAEPRYFDVTNANSYRYYALKCANCWGSTHSMGFRRLSFQVADIPTLIYETKDFKWGHAHRITEVRIQAKGGNFTSSYSLNEGANWSDPKAFANSSNFVEYVHELNKTAKSLRVRIESEDEELEVKWIEPWYIERKRTTSLTRS
jgi:hypothetical protein